MSVSLVRSELPIDIHHGHPQRVIVLSVSASARRVISIPDIAGRGTLVVDHITCLEVSPKQRGCTLSVHSNIVGKTSSTAVAGHGVANLRKILSSSLCVVLIRLSIATGLGNTLGAKAESPVEFVSTSQRRHSKQANHHQNGENQCGYFLHLRILPSFIVEMQRVIVV